MFRHFERGIRNRNLAAHPPAASAYTPSLISFFSNYLIIQTSFFSRDFSSHSFLVLFIVLSHCWFSSSGAFSVVIFSVVAFSVVAFSVVAVGCSSDSAPNACFPCSLGGLASPRHATRCKGWDGLNPRRQRIALSRWADQGISGALVQSQSCKCNV